MGHYCFQLLKKVVCMSKVLKQPENDLAWYQFNVNLIEIVNLFCVIFALQAQIKGFVETAQAADEDRRLLLKHLAEVENERASIVQMRKQVEAYGKVSVYQENLRHSHQNARIVHLLQEAQRSGPQESRRRVDTPNSRSHWLLCSASP